MSADAPLSVGSIQFCAGFRRRHLPSASSRSFSRRARAEKNFSLQIVHAAPVELVGLGVLADGQALHEPLPEIVPVFRQDCFQGVVQKLQILFQLGEVTSCDGGEPSFLSRRGDICSGRSCSARRDLWRMRGR